MKAALVIQNCPAGAFDHNLSQTLAFATSAADQGATLVVFPEMNLTGYLTRAPIQDLCRPVTPELTRPFKELAEQKNITILTGLAEKGSAFPENSSKAGFNDIFASHLIFTPDGNMQVYRKIHTAPFEKQFFSAGNRTVMFETCGFKIGIQLCYDAHFPEFSLSLATKGVDIICIPHASPRNTPEDKYDSWLRHLTARAFDNGVYIAACNQTGDNGKGLNFPGLCLLIGPDGRIIYKSTDPEPAIHMINFEKKQLSDVRNHQMRYFLPQRRNDLFNLTD